MAYDFTQMWSLRNKNKMNKGKKKETNQKIDFLVNKLMIVRGEVNGEWINKIGEDLKSNLPL